MYDGGAMNRRPAFFTFLALLVLASPVMAQVSADFFTGGGIRIGTSTTPCTSGVAGAIRWSSTSDLHEVCDGVEWRALLTDLLSTGGTPVTPTGVGYFVLTSGTWDGNLGGMNGAADKCLADLTANNWMGKADATTRGIIDFEHIKPFLCGGSHGCPYAVPNVAYYFAVSGDATKGGAFFTATSAGNGPNDASAWSGSTYFDGTKDFWSGNNNANGNSLFGNSAGTPTVIRCNGWISNSAAHGGTIGLSTATTSGRWASTTPTCDNTKRLVCFVHP